MTSKFSAGQRATILRGGINAPGGVCSIIRALPSNTGGHQYQVRTDGDPFDRIIDESRLEASAEHAGTADPWREQPGA